MLCQLARFSPARACLLLAAPLLLTFGARAQRVEGGPPDTEPFKHPAAPEVPGGRYLSHKAVWDYDTVRNQVNRVMLDVRATDGSLRRIQTWAPGVVKISYFAPGRRPVADSSVSIVQPPQPVAYETVCNPGCDGPRTAAQIRKYGPDICSGVLVYPQKLVFNVNCQIIEIDKGTLAVRLYTNYRGSYPLSPEPLFSEASAAYRRQPTTRPDPNTPPIRIDELASLGVRFQLQPGERLYGTGSRALPLDRRGYRLELYNQAHYGYGNGEPALNVTMPVVLSSRGYMLLFDHYAAGYLDMGKQNPNVLEYGLENHCSHSFLGELCGDNLSYFVITGQNQAEILNRYTALTGRQPLPPRWALGLIQSRFGYRSQAEMLNVASQMRRNNFPLDGLVLDLYWFGGTTRQGDFAWDAANFPDPAGMIRDLKAQGVNTILISEPYVMRTSRNDSLVRTQGLVGTTAAGRRGKPYTVGSFWAGPASILDVFKPQTRTWMWAQYQRLHDQGAAGWWSDLGEPENHPEAMHHVLGTTRQVHNAYGITWAKIFQDNYAKEYPNERLFNLARSGWAGMQRNSVFPWSGDISRTWSGLQAQVPIMLSMGQVGVGYMHSDAGGFGANATQDPELYTRWLQMAALCPIMRPHSDQVVAPEPYTYPEPYKSIVRDYAHLRATLLPYLYTLAAENTLTGAPLVRTVDYYTAYNFYTYYRIPNTIPILKKHLSTAYTPDSARRAGAMSINYHPYTWSTVSEIVPAPLPLRPGHHRTQLFAPISLNDQYLLGSELLVAPVSQPGQRRRNVTLPHAPGGWVDWETGQTLPSAQTVGLLAPLARLPLLVRAGAVIPTSSYRPTTAAYQPDTLGLRYYPTAGPGCERNFTVYEDDGHSAQALSQHQFVTFRVETDNMANDGWGVGDKLTINKVGDYEGQPTRRFVRLTVARVAAMPTAILLNGEPLPASTWVFDATHHLLTLTAALGRTTIISFPGLRLLTTPVANLDPETLTLTAPDSRTFTDEVAIHYTRYTIVDQPETLHIRDQRGLVVRELPTLADSGPQTLRWDGRDAQGRAVPAGMYVAEVAGQHQVLRRLPE